MKRIWKREEAGGFTLIELIVVFAITAVLAGVGTVTYTAYVQRANKAVDQQTVADLIYATKLAGTANQGLIEDGSSVFIAITENGTKVAGGSDADVLESAIEDSVGDLSSIKLNYTEWSGAADGETLNDMITYLVTIGYLDSDGNILLKDSEGNALTASYAASADDLWELVVSLAEGYAAENGGNAAECVAMFADYTVSKLKATTAADMGNIWAATTKTGRALYSISSADKETMATAYAVWYAQCNAFAEYLSSNYTLVDGSTVLEEIKSKSNTDIVWTIYSSETAPTGTSTAQSANWTTLHEAAVSYLSGGTNSQAYADGMIYFALMDTINTVTTDGTYNVDDDDYLDNIAAYVSIAGTAMSGTIDFASMYELATSLDSEGMYIGITMTKRSDGQWEVSVSPSEADVTNSQSTTSDSGDDGETVYTEDTIEARVSASSGTLAITSGDSWDTTSSAYTLNVTGVAYNGTAATGTVYTGTISGSYPTYEWTTTKTPTSGSATTSTYTSTFSLTLNEGSSGITVDSDSGTITAEKGATGTVTLKSSLGSKTKTITFTVTN